VRPLAARRHVPRPREELYAVLSDLPGHWKLAGRWVEPLELHDHGGVVRVHGPLGLRRTITTSLTDTREPERVAGEAVIGATRAAISWTLVPEGSGTLVTLRADVLACSPLDRVLLALGGRAWMQRRLASTLHELG
jgi:hypothetical protein